MFKTTTTLAQAISMAAAAPMTADYGYEKAVAVLASENLKFVPRSDIPEDADLEGTHLIKLIGNQDAVHAWIDVEIYESEFLRPWIQIYRTAAEYTSEQLLNVQKLLIALSAEFDIYSQQYEHDIVREMFMPFQKSEMDGMYRIEKGCMKPALEQFKIHAFAGRASADVYDQTQTDSSIKDGDLLDLGGGNIGILLQAWPTVVCGEIDQFHTLADGESFDSYQEGKYSAAARKAREIAALAVRTTDTKKQSPLEIVESVCRDFDGDGLASVGATAALRAMSEHWKNHLNEGRKPRIMSEDIDELKEQLEVMRAEIMRRLEAVTCDTAAPAVTSATGV